MATLQALDEPKTLFPLITLIETETSDKAQASMRHKLGFKESHSLAYNTVAFRETCYTSTSNRTTAIHYRPKVLVARGFPVHAKLSKLCQRAKVTHFFREKEQRLTNDLFMARFTSSVPSE